MSGSSSLCHGFDRINRKLKTLEMTEPGRLKVDSEVHNTETNPLYVTGNVQNTENNPLYITGNVQNTVENPLYITGDVQNTENNPLYVISNVQNTETNPLYVFGNVQNTENNPLYITGNVQNTVENPLYITGDVQNTEHNPLYVISNVQNTETNPLYITGNVQNTATDYLYVMQRPNEIFNVQLDSAITVNADRRYNNNSGEIWNATGSGISVAGPHGATIEPFSTIASSWIDIRNDKCLGIFGELTMPTGGGQVRGLSNLQVSDGLDFHLSLEACHVDPDGDGVDNDIDSRSWHEITGTILRINAATGKYGAFYDNIASPYVRLVFKNTDAQARSIVGKWSIKSEGNVPAADEQ